jgi:hypothetical protein
MPFTPYRSTFGPETLSALQEAFDMAFTEVLAAPDPDMDEQVTRDLIAQRIVEAAQEHGERDPVRLKDYALQGFKT